MLNYIKDFQNSCDLKKSIRKVGVFGTNIKANVLNEVSIKDYVIQNRHKIRNNKIIKSILLISL